MLWRELLGTPRKIAGGNFEFNAPKVWCFTYTSQTPQGLTIQFSDRLLVLLLAVSFFWIELFSIECCLVELLEACGSQLRSPRRLGNRWKMEDSTPLNKLDMGVSKNRCTPKSSILIGFSIINHPFSGFSPYFLETPTSKMLLEALSF